MGIPKACSVAQAASLSMKKQAGSLSYGVRFSRLLMFTPSPTARGMVVITQSARLNRCHAGESSAIALGIQLGVVYNSWAARAPSEQTFLCQ
jgi:hypothetical protein